VPELGILFHAVTVYSTVYRSTMTLKEHNVYAEKIVNTVRYI